jgi:hypothetical protein
MAANVSRARAVAELKVQYFRIVGEKLEEIFLR